jgi:hypothetical protein
MCSIQLLKEFGTPNGGGCKIVVGNTEVGIGVTLLFLGKYTFNISV